MLHSHRLCSLLKEYLWQRDAASEIKDELIENIRPLIIRNYSFLTLPVAAFACCYFLQFKQYSESPSNFLNVIGML